MTSTTNVLGMLVVLSAVLAAPCPPLKSATVQVSCVHLGRAVDCAGRPSPPGTVATFRCKPLHQYVLGYLPPTSESRCGENGQWSLEPFRCVPVCGRPTGKPKPYVRNGEKVGSAADYPWFVTIYDAKQGMQQICGGSLITPKFVVSAAHCFYDTKLMPAERFVAGVAKTRRAMLVHEPNAQFRQARSIHIPKEYGARKLHYANDIALMELVRDVDVTAWTLPVCVDWGLEQPDLTHGQEGTVVGFGNGPENASEELRFTKLPFIRSDECRKLVSEELAIYTHISDKFCVGFFNGTTVAPGDSGGGLSFASEDRIWYLRGIVSVGSRDLTTYSYFTNVTAFIPWITGIIQEGELTGRRCGVDVVETSVVDGAKVGRMDFPWEVEVYYKQAANLHFERLSSAVLVQPNLAITTVLQNISPERQVDVAEYPVQWLRVVSRRNTDSFELSEAAIASEVVRAFYPHDVLISSALFYNFILLELKQPMNLMPVCLDWSGALLGHQNKATAIEQAPGSNTMVWRKFDIQNRDRCAELAKRQVDGPVICVESEGDEEPQLHQSLLVHVDNTWFLRGVLSAVRDHSGSSHTLQYTDMGDPGVTKWLSNTRDFLGKPTCGNVNLCQGTSYGGGGGEKKDMRGHLPWTVAVVVDDGRTSVNRGAGLLVQSNAVLTDVDHILNKTASNVTNPVLLPAQRVSVLWTDAAGNAKRSGVVNLWTGSSSGHDIALLEVLEGQAIEATPVCLDLGGRVLEHFSSSHSGLVETWREWGPVNHTLLSAQYQVERIDCLRNLQTTRNAANRRQFCATVEKTSIAPSVHGAGFLVNSGNKWFVQGMFTNHVKFRSFSLMLATDFSDPDLRSWLRKKLDRLPNARVEAKVEATEKTTCTKKECGVFVPVALDLPEGVDPLESPSPNHMEWNVDVHVMDPQRPEQWQVRAGTVISGKLVVTSATGLVAPGGAKAIPSGSVLVRYISSTRRARRIAVVEDIQLRERSQAARRAGASRFDVALLYLQSAVSLTPVCVPLPGWVGSGLARVKKGATGQTEVFPDVKSVDRTLVPTSVRAPDECRRLTNQSAALLAADEFCAQPSSGGLLAVPQLGSGFALRADGSWFLRGIMSEPAQGALPFYSLDNVDILVWLTERMRVKGVLAETPPPPRSQCGVSSDALDMVTFGKGSAPVPGHLPWGTNVVYIKVDTHWDVTPGVLIREDMVLTNGRALLKAMGRPNNVTGDVLLVGVADLKKLGVTAGRERRRSQVLQVMVHGHDTQNGGVALIKVTTPFRDSSLPCLDLDDEAASQPLASGQIGVLETRVPDFIADRTSDRLLVSTRISSAEDCRREMATYNNTVVRPDVPFTGFCTGKLKGVGRPGTGVFVKNGHLWYVRGIIAFGWTDDSGPYGPYAVTDLQDGSVRDWLRRKLRDTSAPSKTANRVNLG